VNDAESWNKALFETARGSFDYVAPHPYIGVQGSKSPKVKLSPEESYLKTLAKVWRSEDLARQQEIVRNCGWGARLAVTEWACNFSESVPGNQKWEEGLYYYTLGCGLGSALYFGKILEGSDVTDIAVFHSVCDSQTLWYWPAKELAKGAPLLHPNFLALELWGANLGNRRLPLSSGAVPQMEIEGKSYPALYSFASEDERNVYLVVINLDMKSELRLDVGFKNCGALDSSASALWLDGPSIATDNFGSWGFPEKAPVKLSSQSLPLSGCALSVAMPAHSILGLKIAKR